MNTYLNSAQEALKEQYAAFARDEVKAKADALCRHEICLKEFLTSAGEKGYLGLHVPQEFGGHGHSLLDLLLMVEAVSQFEPGLGLTLANHAAVLETLKKFGSEKQKSTYLPLLARGEIIGTLAFSEQTAGTDFEAVKSELAGGCLSGKKTNVVSGDFASLLIVLLKEGERLALYLVDLRQAKGVKRGPHRPLLGLNSTYINDIDFEQTEVSAENQISGGESASEMTLYAMDVAKVVLSGAAVGLLEGCSALAVEHARRHEQFGLNIGQFQGIQWKLSDMTVETTGARLQSYRAAWAHDENPQNFRQYASMAKLFCARAARFHTGEALQIMGSAGLEADSPLSRFYRDAKTMEIIQGTAEFQKMLLVKELDI